MSQWPFTVQHKPSPEQIERLRKATTSEVEQGIAREIASIDERLRTAEARVQTLEQECARLTEELALARAGRVNLPERKPINAPLGEDYTPSEYAVVRYAEGWNDCIGEIESHE